jgi:hypothetical protein
MLKASASPYEVAPSKVMELWLNVVTWGLIIVSMLSMAYVFGYDLNAPPWNTDNLRAGTAAVAIDSWFFASLYFSRRFWGRSKAGGFGWFVSAFAFGVFSWFCNVIFFATFLHTISTAVLARAGMDFFSQQGIIKAVCMLLSGSVLLYCLAPRRLQRDTRTEEERAQDTRSEEEQQERLIRKVRGWRQLVAVASGAEEREKQRKEEEKKREAREQKREKQRALFARGVELGLITGQEDVIDYTILEQRIKMQDMPIPTAEQLATEDVQENEEPMSDTGNHHTTLNEQEVAEFLGVSVQTARKMMEPFSDHEFNIPGCRNKTIRRGRNKGKVERRAPYDKVKEVKKRMEDARKIRPLRKQQSDAQEAAEELHEAMS